MVLRYVDNAGGPEGMLRLADMLGIDVDTLRASGRWDTMAEAARLFTAAAEVCGDRQIGRRAGEEHFSQLVERGAADLFLEVGSVERLVERSIAVSTRETPARPVSLLEMGASHAVFEAVYVNPANGHRVFCDFLAGYFSKLPVVFGKQASIVETACQLDGGSVCIYRLVWRHDPFASYVPAGAEEREGRAEGHVERFEDALAMASVLVSAGGVDEALERIVDQVNQNLRAPRYVLAVHLADGDELRVHSFGFEPSKAKAYAELVMSGELTEADGVVAAEVASSTRSYGLLAALFKPGAHIDDRERRVLRAFAGHAAAALEVIASLDGARRDRDLAKALLDLARALAEVRTGEEISARLVAAVPSVTGAPTATVWLLDPHANSLVLRGAVGFASSRRLSANLGVGDLPRLLDVIGEPRPMFLEASSGPMSLLHGLRGTETCAAVPIVSKGAFLGLVTAGFSQPPTEATRADVIDRLTGLADHAALALENSGLLERVQHEAWHDRLTGLPNRPLVEDRGRLAFAAAARSAQPIGLLFVDLDRFKIVNDTLGHHAGDDLLCQVARRLQDCLRASDTLGRLGGDEFVVLLPEISGIDDAVEVAGRLVDVLQQPFEVLDEEVFVSCSVGVAISPADGNNYDALLLHADAAMYAAKGRGRNCYTVHAPTDGVGRRQQFELESQLHKALEHHELRVFYQPQVDLNTGAMTGVEALVRWRHPDLGLLEPGAFLEMAEESGLIVTIDEWVRRTAFAQARQWANSGHPLRVAVNLSTRALTDPCLPAKLAAEIRHAGVAVELVELEITDRVVLTETELPRIIENLRALGVQLAIDDFGTGTSILGRLHNSPIDTLKIDKSFVSVVADNTLEAPLLRGIIALARNLGVAVVAEGVETVAQAAILRRYGCDTGQGYLFSRPVPPEDISRLCRGKLPAHTLRGLDGGVVIGLLGR